MKLQTLLPLAGLVSGLITFAPGAAQAQQCKTTSDWQACFYSSGAYSIRMRDGNWLDGQCGSGVRRSPGFPYAVASQIHYNYCDVPLDLN